MESCPHRRALIKTVLASYYDVISARDGTQALDILDENNDFDLILIDAELNAPTGREIAYVIKEFYPHLYEQVCFISNSIAESVSEPVLIRPFNLKQLVSIIPLLAEKVVYDEMLS